MSCAGFVKENLHKVILTTGFWKHPGDAAITEYGKEYGLPVIELGDLGDDEKMKAIVFLNMRPLQITLETLAWIKLRKEYFVYKAIICKIREKRMQAVESLQGSQ